MTLRVDVEEGAARWPEIVAEVEAGREVVITRGVDDVARVKGTANPRHTPQEVINAILEIRSRMPPTTIDEILAWRDEGRW